MSFGHHNYGDDNVLRNLGDMILRIEIDSDRWVGTSAAEKFEYLKYQLNASSKSQLLNVGSRLLDGILDLIKYNTKNPVLKSYVDLADTAIGLVKVSMVLNNAFVAHDREYRSENDELAQFMGKSIGPDISVFDIDSTAEASRVFLHLSAEQQAKYGIHFDKIEYLNDNSTELVDTPINQESHGGVTAFVLMSTQDGHRMGFEIYYDSPRKRKLDSNDVNKNDMFSYIKVGFYDNDIQPLAIPESIIYSAYIDSIDVKKNYIRIDAGKMRPEPRKVIDYDIKNINIPEMVTTIGAVLKKHQRRGYMLQGDPGTGKTVSIHKIIMSFPDTPVFWISSDSIDTPSKVRNVFRILNMFPGSIFVFDDIDGNDMSTKNQLTTTFLSCIDATNSAKFNGILILTVNEPQRIHGSIKTRPERIDEVIMVHNPPTVDAVLDVVVQRFKHLHEDLPDWVSKDNAEFVSYAERIVANQFTHAQIATLISDLVKLFRDDADNYNVSMFGNLISRRVLSIANTKMEANSDGHIVTKPAAEDKNGKSVKNM